MFRNTTKKSPFLAYRDAYERIVRCKRPHQTDSGSRLTKTAVDFVAEIRRKEKKVPKIPGNNNSSNRSAAAAAKGVHVCEFKLKAIIAHRQTEVVVSSMHGL